MRCTYAVTYMKDNDPKPANETWLGLTIGACAVLTVIMSFIPRACLPEAILGNTFYQMQRTFLAGKG